jgi:hypothetical protein
MLEGTWDLPQGRPRDKKQNAAMTSGILGKWTPARLADGVAVVLLALVAAAAAATFRDYGLGWDDYTHSEYGDLLLAFYTSGFTDRRAFSFVNLYLYGGGFDLIAAIAAKVLPFGVFETRRLLGAAVGLMGLITTWRLGRRLGGPFAGVVALALLATCPLFYGHMFMNAKDAPFAVAMTLLLLGLVRAFQEFPKPGWATIAVFGLGLGLTLGSRIMGAMTGVYALAALLLLLAVEHRQLGWSGGAAQIGRFMLRLLPGVAIAYAVMAVVWPWAVVDPLNPFRALAYFSHFFEKPWRELYDGATTLVIDMPRSYLPTLLALKLPEVMLALGFGGVAGAFVMATRRDVPAGQRAAFLTVALAVAFPIALTVATRPAMYNGIRHFIFILPPLAALGGFAAAWVVDRLHRRSLVLRAGAVAALLVGIALPADKMVRLHPYQYTHFNMIAGGVRVAGDRYMLDYWGLAFAQASRELRETLASHEIAPPAGRRWRVAVCGPHPAARVELGPGFELVNNTLNADFALVLGEYYCRELNAPVYVEVERDGAVYARVYNISGRTVGTLTR